MPDMWAESDKNWRSFRNPADSLKKKVFLQINGTNGKRILWRGAFEGPQPNRYQQPKMGNQKPQKLGFCKFGEFNDEIIFQVRSKWRRYRQKIIIIIIIKCTD